MMIGLGRDRPTPLPVQALDQATGYLMAGAALQGLLHRRRGEGALAARPSLARPALLLGEGGVAAQGAALTGGDGDWAAETERTGWGPARRLRPPANIEGAGMRWDRPAGPLGSAEPIWSP